MPIFRTSKLYTLDKFIKIEEKNNPHESGEFSSMMLDFIFAVKLIASNIRRTGMNDLLGLTHEINLHGEVVKKLDVYANLAIIESMRNGGHVYGMISEENEAIIQVPDHLKSAEYILAFDPLDGSTNIDVCSTIGTIFSVLKSVNSSEVSACTEENIFQAGYNQVAAGYILYGSSTILAYTTGAGVHIFTYEPLIGEFVLTYENIKIPKFGLYYSCNEAYSHRWSTGIRKYMHNIKSYTTADGKAYCMRYLATVAADVHRLLHTGGIYLFPSLPELPEGKIRMLYEANPLAMIIEQAGGIASTGNERILDIIPESIHQRVPFFVGSPDNITELLEFMKEDKL
ncbi:MAG: class 1 fructose-bisphosphatase [Candidatus Kapabacteria bacterium]|nr:class 1 fructose-bisphosphatase [Candidatus Kapabacteria bacterium]